MMRFALALSVLVLTLSTHAATFTVSTTNDSGAGSLRQAIVDANTLAGSDTIEFNIAGAGVHTITPLTSLPTVTGPVVIDGYTQTGASANTLAVGGNAVLLIEIEGVTAGGVGLQFLASASNSTVRGLVINRFATGIYLNGADVCVIEGNYIGTDPTGTLDEGNTSFGVLMLNGATSNLIGGPLPAARNVLSGNNNDVGIGDLGTIGNSIVGNYIGVTAAGTASVAGDVGINLNSAGATSIGGSGSSANVISGHTVGGNGSGLYLINASSGISINGNIIGLGADGTTPIPNEFGIRVGHGPSGSPINTEIGTLAPNTIAHNLQEGIVMTTNGSSFIEGLQIAINSIHDNGQLGIDIDNDGVTANDTLDGDSGINDRQNFPVVTSANSLGGNLTIHGSLQSTPNDTFTVQLFHNTTCDPSGNGEGETYLGSVTVTTDGSGNGTFNMTIASALTSGGVTATATNDATENTSEFSECQPLAVVAQPFATINDVSVFEANAGTTLATFTVFLSAAPPAGASISYTTADGTATTADNDYVAASGNAIFAAGQTTQTIDVTINGDVNVEPDQTFFVNLTGATNATITDNQGIGTIVADDGLPTVSIAGASTAEGNLTTTPLTFTVSVSPIPAFDVTVSYATSDASAIAPDYVPASGTVTIPAGSSSATFDVTINGDTMHELNENFNVTLFNPSNAVITTGTATGTILNDDPVPTVTINDPSVAEGNAGNAALVFMANLSNPSYLNVSVPFTMADGSATAGSDYFSQSGSFTFAPGITSSHLQVQIPGDTTPEPDETLFVNLGAPTNATLGDSQSVGTILNDDVVLLSPDLALTKSGPAGPVALGDTFAYTIVVNNEGAGTATDVTVTDTLPSQVTFVSATPTQGTCNGTTTVNCVLGTLAAGGSATVTITVTATTPGTFSNTASVAGDEVEGDVTDNEDDADVTIAAAAATPAIPTLSEWGIIAMLLALAALAIKRM